MLNRLTVEQTCIELRPLALSMTLPAFAAECGILQQMSIDSWYVAPTDARAQQQTSRTPLLLSVDETDGRMDTRPLRRCYSAYCAGSD